MFENNSYDQIGKEKSNEALVARCSFMAHFYVRGFVFYIFLLPANWIFLFFRSNFKIVYNSWITKREKKRQKSREKKCKMTVFQKEMVIWMKQSQRQQQYSEIREKIYTKITTIIIMQTL